MDDLIGFFGDDQTLEDTKETACKRTNEPNKEACSFKRSGRRRLSSATTGSTHSEVHTPLRLRSSFSFSGLNRAQEAEEMPCDLPPEIEVGNIEYKVSFELVICVMLNLKYSCIAVLGVSREKQQGTHFPLFSLFSSILANLL